MSQHTATISWRRNEAAFTDNRYSRAHVWRFDGGAEVPASATPNVVPPPLSDPAGVDPEEALVAATSACHMLWFLSLAAQKGFLVESYDDEATGELGKNSEGQQAITSVTLRPQVRFAGEKRPSSEDFSTLHHDAHSRCTIANSIKAEVRCEPTAR
jgi:organic hydroperoxide reductase OsmC/OhrA